MDEQLLIRFITDEASESEKMEVLDWLEADAENQRRFDELDFVYTLVRVNPPPRVALRSVPVRRHILRWSLGAAAVLVVALFVGGFLVSRPNPLTPEPADMLTVNVPAGQRVELELPDKTKVWVNAKSTLTYPVDFGRGKREVTLDGEAYFDVEADSKHPFLVKTADANLVVTGTEFNVASYSGSGILSVALLEGKVSLQSASDGALLYTMSPSEQAELSEGRINVSAIEYPDYFRWREGLICFNNETVGDIIKKLELYYDIKIDVQREGLLQRRYSGKFRTKAGVEQVLRTLRMEHRFRFVKDEENNSITIK